jgi:hypothetical protein
MDKNTFFNIFLIFIIIPLITLLFWFCYNLYTDYRDNKPQQITQYWDIKLGETLETVKFIKGFPSKKFEFCTSSLGNFDIGKANVITYEGRFGSVLLKDLSNILQKYKVSTKFTCREHFEAWEYVEGDNEAKYFIRFTGLNTVGAISCTGNKSYSCATINSVGINATWDQVIKTFGSPSYGYRDFNDGTRVVCYPQYNLCFTLAKSRVQFVTIKSWKAEDYYELGQTILDIPSGSGENYEHSINAFDQAIKLDPKYTKAYIAKGWVLYSLQKYDQTIKLYNDAIKLGYKSADLYNKLGLALQNSHKILEAMRGSICTPLKKLQYNVIIMKIMND